MLSRKYYQTIAQILMESRADLVNPNEASEELYRVIVNRLADFFQQDNPDFDRDRFKEACDL